MLLSTQSCLLAKHCSSKAVLIKASASMYAKFLTSPPLFCLVNFKLVSLDAVEVVDAILVKEVLIDLCCLFVCFAFITL